MLIIISALPSIATGLRLHLDSSKANDTESLKETRRRIMWACFCYDSLVSSGIKEFEQFPLHAIRIDLPSNERNFAFSIREPTRQLDVRDYLHSTRHVTSAEGILSHHVALMAIRAATMRYASFLPEYGINGKLMGSCALLSDTLSTSLRKMRRLGNRIPSTRDADYSC